MDMCVCECVYVSKLENGNDSHKRSKSRTSNFWCYKKENIAIEVINADNTICGPELVVGYRIKGSKFCYNIDFYQR